MRLGLGLGITRIGHNGGPPLPSYDADAQAYIDATGELFPDDLNTLVLGIKAAGLWDDHLGSIKKAIGVPSLAASLIDLRNTAFNGTAVNTPGHSATTGWSFVAASSQYINLNWTGGAANSKATQNSVHFGLRMRANTGNFFACVSNGSSAVLGWLPVSNGTTILNANNLASATDTTNPASPGHLIGTRTASTTAVVYRGGTSVASNSNASVAVPSGNLLIASRNNAGTPDAFSTGRATIAHMGAGLDASQAAELTTLFDAYATAAGET